MNLTNFKRLKNYWLFIAIFSFFSCFNDNETGYVDYREQNENEIVKYLSDNNLTAVRSNTGLYYIIDEIGEGNKPVRTDNVTVAYKGYFLNGSVFDQSESGISFNLYRVIAGWTEGMQYFKEGGSGKLLIPAHLGYGSYKYATIPGGSVLIFDVELISINTAAN